MSLTTLLGDTTGNGLSGVYRDSANTLFKDGLGVFEINIQPLNGDTFLQVPNRSTPGVSV